MKGNLNEMALEERKVLLKSKEEELVVKENKLKEKEEEVNKRFRYKLYDRINVSLRTMDTIIAVLVAVLIILVIYGIYKARF